MGNRLKNPKRKQIKSRTTSRKWTFGFPEIKNVKKTYLQWLEELANPCRRNLEKMGLKRWSFAESLKISKSEDFISQRRLGIQSRPIISSKATTRVFGFLRRFGSEFSPLDS